MTYRVEIRRLVNPENEDRDNWDYRVTKRNLSEEKMKEFRSAFISAYQDVLTTEDGMHAKGTNGNDRVYVLEITKEEC